MAILEMQRINVYALNKYCKNILETLQQMGVVQIEELNLEDSVFYKTDSSSMASSYQRNAALMKNAQDVLKEYNTYKTSLLSSFEGKKIISTEEYEEYSEKASEYIKVAYDLISDSKRIIEYKAKIIGYSSKIEALSPWKNLDVPLSENRTKNTRSVIGTFSERITEEELRLSFAKSDPNLDNIEIEIISSDDRQTCVFVMCMSEDYDRLMSVMRKSGFSLPAVSTKESPVKEIEKLRSKTEEKQKLILELRGKIEAQKELLEVFCFFEDYFVMKADRYSEIRNLSYSPNTFVLTGYIPKKDSESIKKLLFEKYDAEVELEDADGDDVPVKISNNKFTEPVEGVLLSYSAPNRKELDPTAIMAIFYYVFFGLMFSDAGYGLVMALACGVVVKKFKNMSEGLMKSIKMFFWCGVSTFIWGLLFGSFFGDAVSVISNTFFGSAPPNIPGITTPLWFSATEDPTKLLMFSFLLGIIHLFTGLTLQAVNYIRSGKFIYAIYDDLSWILLVTGATLALLSTEMLAGMAGFRLPSVFLSIGGVIALVGAVIILFCSARNKNPVKRLVKGAYNLYGVTSYLSDILSYSRLLALGLATGVVAQVFNQLGSMFGGGVVGVILFTLVFLIGHSLNIGINALGAYVHTNRLQFVEFFGKFYEGGGREFAPYEAKTKYYNIKEDI